VNGPAGMAHEPAASRYERRNHARSPIEVVQTALALLTGQRSGGKLVLTAGP
jgi:hypothetical protein